MNNAIEPAPAASGDPVAAVLSGEKAAGRVACFHCGLPCGHEAVTTGDRSFCCSGCRLVCELLEESGLGRFYELGQHPGIQVRTAAQRE